MNPIRFVREWLRGTTRPFAPPSAAAAAAAEVTLQTGESARFDAAEGRELTALAGRLWITHDGDPKDIVVDAGERYFVARRERMIVHAIRNGCFRLG